MTKDEALKLALEALQMCTNQGMIPMYLEKNNEAITSIHKALAQPVQESEPPAGQPLREPVATISITRRGSSTTIDNHFEDCVRDWPEGEYKLVLAPPLPLQPEERNFCPRCGKRRGGDVNYIHTCTPPQENT
jgi:hypothetical protein